MPASCPNHGLTAEAHCEEIEKMLEHVPGNFCEGDGDSPADAVKRLAEAYEELKAEHEEAFAVLLVMQRQAPDEWTRDIAGRTLDGSIADWLKALNSTPTPGDGRDV